jgi:arsenate reductase (thioredoxin)
MPKPRVFFLCGANACRTQMAEAFLRDLAGDRFEVLSAGYQPADHVSPDAIEAMRELGIDISGQHSRKTAELLGQRAAYVITLCDREKERSCLIFPGAATRLVWPPERKVAVRQIRDEIRRRVVEFIGEHA